jgi:hypothetical protein
MYKCVCMYLFIYVCVPGCLDEGKDLRPGARPSPIPAMLDFSSLLDVSAIFFATKSILIKLELVRQSTWPPSWSAWLLRSSSWPATLPATPRRSGVNFTNILRAVFLYGSFFAKLYLLTIWVCNFLAKEFWRKSCS